ncbi:hypothetical protein [Streptomyces sp. NPDC004685]
MDTAVRGWLLDQLGASTDVAGLEARYTRLGSARAVAISVIQGRLAELHAQPASVNVSSVVGVSYIENIKAYERQLAALGAGENPAPDVQPDTGPNALGMLEHRDGTVEVDRQDRAPSASVAAVAVPAGDRRGVVVDICCEPLLPWPLGVMTTVRRGRPSVPASSAATVRRAWGSGSPSAASCTASISPSRQPPG